MMHCFSLRNRYNIKEKAMADLIIQVVFSGLIALVPGSQGHSDSMTAYLLDTSADHCMHSPEILMVGCLSVIKNSHNCDVAEGVVSCDLSNTDIILDPAPVEHMRYLKSKPNGNLPHKLDEGENISWLVHIANLGGEGRSIKSNLDGLTSARFRFGWDEAKTCLLDENGEGKVHNFEFCPLDDDLVPNCSARSTHQQAVAEAVMFKLRLAAGPVRLILRERGNAKKETIVELMCPSGICPVVGIGNDMFGVGCDEENLVFGMHFAKFYRLLRDGGKGGVFVPHRSNEFVDENVVVNNCGLGEYLSKLGQQCRLDLSKIPEVRANDRVICPPVVIEP